MKKPRWTPAEDRVIRQNYSSGAPHTARRLAAHGYDRTPKAVRDRARNIGVTFIPRDMVPAAWLAPNGGGAFYTVVDAARKDGVLKDRPQAPVRYLVPEWWADAYAQLIRDRQDAEDLIGTWWTIDDLAEQTGMTKQQVWTHLSHPRCRLPRLFEHVETRYTHNPRRRLWHPEQAAEAVREWRALRKAAA